MTTQTTVSGWLFVIAGALCLLGAAIVIWVRSEAAEKRALAREVNSLYAAGIFLAKQNARLRNVLGNERVQMVLDAEVLADPDSVLISIPEQRQPYDREREGL